MMQTHNSREISYEEAIAPLWKKLLVIIVTGAYLLYIINACTTGTISSWGFWGILFRAFVFVAVIVAIAIYWTPSAKRHYDLLGQVYQKDLERRRRRE